MDKIIKYSVLRYSPSPVSGERINLGILFYDEDTGDKDFYFSHNFIRLKKFDDELDTRAVRDMLIGIRDDITESINGYQFSIEEFTRFYINDYKFGSIKSIAYKEWDSIVERLKRTYFRFDYDKKERPSKSDDKKLISEWITSSGHAISSSSTVMGEFNEPIRYDIVTDDSLIKIIDFDNKQLGRSINQAKLWAWNSNHSQKKVYIVYRYSDTDPKQTNNFSIIRNIFKDSKAYFCSLEEYEGAV